jgi:hypothetical protein
MSRMTSVLSLAAVIAVAYGGSAVIPVAGAKSAKKPTHRIAILAGTWSGQYGGSYSGTFTLHWTQTGGSLSGSITLSNPASTLSVNGTLHNSTITFGTVGAYGITYTGTESGGTSMSGSYKVANGGSGSWSADKKK